MNNPVLESALIELQESLSKIESARTQVNNVAEKSELLISSFTKALDAINSISNNINFDEESFNSEVNNSIKVLENSLAKIVKKSESKVNDLDINLSKHEAGFAESLNRISKSTENKIKDLLLEIKVQTVSNAKLIEAELTTFKENVRRANEQFSSFESNIKNLERMVKDFNYPAEIRTIEEKIDANKTQNLIFSIIIILGLIVVIAILK